MSDETSLHLRRARAGDGASAEWLAQRLQPLLLAQARFRLSSRLARLCEPEDLVAEVWTVAFPRLATLQPREDRVTPVLLRFLSTTLVQIANNLARKAIRRGVLGGADRMDDATSARGVSALADDARGVVTRVELRESGIQVRAALDDLSSIDRAIVVLRGVEQVPGAEVASRLGLTENAVSLRYRRALARLRERLPDSVLADLPDEA